VAIVTPRDAADPQAAGQLEAALVEAVKSLPNVQLVTAAKAGRGPMEVRADPRPGARAQLVGKETGAEQVLVVDLAPLPDGTVVYLQAIETAQGRSLRSTTASLPSGLGDAARTALRGAVTRVLAPDRYRGRLLIKVDVPGAEVLIDGRKIASASGPIELTVGTHALRVTHPAYRDYLHFVDVEFDRTLELPAALAAYPLAEGEMTEKARRAAPTQRTAVPWYRSWWAVTTLGVVLTGVTAGLVAGLRPTISSDKTIDYQTRQGP
jgi:hypothetical protein